MVKWSEYPHGALNNTAICYPNTEKLEYVHFNVAADEFKWCTDPKAKTCEPETTSVTCVDDYKIEGITCIPDRELNIGLESKFLVESKLEVTLVFSSDI
jgi:hypothetical protein